ncbi:fasciclin domain-containing protein [Altericista sp. CCNU0014]|uniref:fasciclin domain-containing protein n=1 Tax=Altericista sp. CCNU0014 TaxID=3082949 RepID=UPI00384E50F7
MISKTTQRFLPATLGLAFALGLLANVAARATTPVKMTQGSGTMQSPGMMKSPGMMRKVPTQKTPAKTGTVVDVASGISDFSTLVAAIKAAELTTTLSSRGPFTVFAPTNAAFDKLPKGTVETLLKPENKAKLRKVLTYHVVPGKVLSTAIKPGPVKTVEGSTVNLQTSGGNVTVNTAKVVKADVAASNGVIHVIDTVILPPNL